MRQLETDMNIITNTLWGDTESTQVVRYVELSLDADSRTSQGTHNAHLALGRLLEVLAEKGILTAPDITQVASYRDDSATFEP